MEHLLDEELFGKMIESFWSRTWNKFTIFGNTVAGILGIFLAIKVLKGVIDTILQGYALHSVYGWSLKLLGAIFTSVTQLLLHLATRDESRPETNNDIEARECIPLNPVDPKIPSVVPRSTSLADNIP